MKYFIDGNQLVLTNDDFVDLQESPAGCFPLDERGQRILATLEMTRTREEVALEVFDILKDAELETLFDQKSFCYQVADRLARWITRPPYLDRGHRALTRYVG